MPRLGASTFRAWSRRSVFALGLAATACATAPGVPEPGFVTPFDVVAPDSILEYLRELRFDSRDGASHEQRLLVGCPDACRLGPQVMVQPERRSHNNEHEDLATGPGRIIARFINRDLKEGYPRLNLAPGDTVYWAVDSVQRVSNAESRGRSLYISTRALRSGRGERVKPGRLVIDEHPEQGKLNMSMARWYIDTAGYDAPTQMREAPGGGSTEQQFILQMMAWGNCKSGGCCR